ncbi:GPI-anchored protein LLG1-like [Telopea speciosissima]|uniref:GPI-anchored protein LLG1-like n=1 Tax=Telopea speciosissima TaxID=54955 RepID=UPI001CC6BB6A|nr:GPI-anchored protein LLG1-like [Telopea speciosissima]
MTWNHCFFAFLFFLSTSLATSSFISDNVFESHESTGRTLLQAKKSCTVNFEFLNYTIITSQCKGPKYPTKLCCEALQEFACPYAEQLNDLTNDCASTMFSYINLYGKYPPGLFASECRGDKFGLTCDAPPPAENVIANGALIVQTVPHFLLLLAGSLIVLIQML